ncbi:MAG: hypothetical protein MAG458_00418 [Nitrosopumilus sp.]|nr:hypothetical protein [Nitrosopumilus sp.]
MRIIYCICTCGCRDISNDIVCDLCKSKLCDFSIMKMSEKVFKSFLDKKTEFIH